MLKNISIQPYWYITIYDRPIPKFVAPLFLCHLVQLPSDNYIAAYIIYYSVPLC